jgi:hypothetical protein
LGVSEAVGQAVLADLAERRAGVVAQRLSPRFRMPVPGSVALDTVEEDGRAALDVAGSDLLRRGGEVGGDPLRLPASRAHDKVRNVGCDPFGAFPVRAVPRFLVA